MTMGENVCSYNRTNTVKSLAQSRPSLFDKDQCSDPALLFQRFILVSQSGDDV